MHSSHLSYKYEHFFVEATFSKSIIFRVKNTLEPNVLKSIIINFFISSNPFTLLIIKVKILSKFQKECPLKFQRVSTHLRGSFDCNFTL